MGLTDRQNWLAGLVMMPQLEAKVWCTAIKKKQRNTDLCYWMVRAKK